MEVLNRTARRIVSGGLKRQKTLENGIECGGVALHSGLSVKMQVCPAAPDTGIVFRRIDVEPKSRDIRARFDNVVDTRLCTKIANEQGISVSTIEHLMAALAGCEIDNAIVELNAGEVPVMDGSSGPFVKLFEEIGFVEQGLPRRIVRVLRSVTVRDGHKFLTITPSDAPSIKLEIDFECLKIGRQARHMPINKDVFLSEIANSRTFGFLDEVEALQAAGLAQGGSLDNAVVLSNGEVLNEGGLRHHDEFVRHKILDCLGDLYLAGAPVLGQVTGSCSGHALNNALLRALLEDETAWVWDTVEEADAVEDTDDWNFESAMATA